MTLDAHALAGLFTEAVRVSQELSPRTQQARHGKLGPSDIGFCRQKAVLVTRETQPTDSRPRWAAAVGTAIHEHMGAILSTVYPDWLVDTADNPNPRVTATLPVTGAQISGTPDILIPKHNCVLDMKTTNGLEAPRRYGTSNNHKMQRHLYAMGAVDAGILNPDLPLYVGNVYLDRSGAEPVPHVEVELFNPAFTEEIDQWVEDVIYAVRHGEESSRDIAASRCETFCEFFTACWGSLPVAESEPIVDTEIITGIDLYVEGRDMAKRGKQMQDEAKAILDGVNGSDGRFQVRWVTIPGSHVDERPAYFREEYKRLDVRAVRR